MVRNLQQKDKICAKNKYYGQSFRYRPRRFFLRGRISLVWTLCPTSSRVTRAGPGSWSRRGVNSQVGGIQRSSLSICLAVITPCVLMPRSSITVSTQSISYHLIRELHSSLKVNSFTKHLLVGLSMF